jgi:hypothetical protein
MERSVVQYFGEVEEGSLVGQQNDILRLLFKNGYDEDAINAVRDSFKSSDVFFSRDIDKLKRQAMRDANAGRPYQESLREIVRLATRYQETKAEDSPDAATGAETVLIYVQHNR